MTEVSILALKARALNFPEPARTLILAEPDNLDSMELITKLAIWDKLLKMAQTGEDR